MEEKNIIKINLKTVILLIALIIIIIMGVFIFKLYSEKREMDEKISNLESKINEKNEIQENNVNQANIQENNENNENEMKEQNNDDNKTQIIENTTNNDEYFKKLLQKYLDLKLVAQENPTMILVELGLVSEEDSYYESSIDEGAYILTDIKFSIFKDKILNQISEKIYKEDLSELYKESNGYVACYNGDASEGKSEIKKFELLKSDNNYYTYDVELKKEFYGVKKYNIEFEKKNDGYIISKIQSK